MISFIAAITKNRVLAKNDKLPWKLPTDLAFYHGKVEGHVTIMGRRTFDVIKEHLTNRERIVITKADEPINAPDVTVVHSIQEALEAVRKYEDEEVIVVGGGQVFTEMLPDADRLYLTEIDATLDGDVFFPEFDHSQWNETSREHHTKNDRDQYDFDFVVYDRKR